MSFLEKIGKFIFQPIADAMVDSYGDVCKLYYEYDESPVLLNVMNHFIMMALWFQFYVKYFFNYEVV